MAAVLRQRLFAVEAERLEHRAILDREEDRRRRATSVLACSCRAHDGSAMMSPLPQAKRQPSMIVSPVALRPRSRRRCRCGDAPSGARRGGASGSSRPSSAAASARSAGACTRARCRRARRRRRRAARRATATSSPRSRAAAATTAGAPSPTSGSGSTWPCSVREALFGLVSGTCGCVVHLEEHRVERLDRAGCRARPSRRRACRSRCRGRARPSSASGRDRRAPCRRARRRPRCRRPRLP